MEYKNFIENSENVQNKNPLSSTANATEGDIIDNKLANCCNNIISISTQKVNKYNFDDIKQKAKRVSVKSFLQKARHGNYICPFCGSGTHKKASGAVKIYDNTNTWYCHKCGENGDVIALYMKLKNVDFTTAIRELSNENYVSDKKADTQAEPDFTDKIHKACSNFIGSPAEIYINKRGISTQIAQKFMLGYSESEYFPDRQKHPALIIPISKSLYICRNIEQGERFSNSKGGKKAIFNIDCLNQNAPIFICESAIDALSIIEVGSQAIALNSVSNHEFLTKELLKLQQIPPFIICLDNDEAGTKTTKSLSVAFANMQIKSIDGRFILNDCKDINEALLKDKSAFIEAVSVAKNKVLDIKLHIKQKHKPFFKIQNLSNELEALNYSVKHNLITNEIEFFENGSKIVVDGNDTIVTFLYSELCDKYRGISINIIERYIHNIARNNQYNPVLEVFNANKWDGKDHLKDVYSALCIDTDDILSRTLILKWFWQGHALLRNTEVNPYGADGVLTLSGNQGIGKTSFFRKMSISSDFFRDGQRINTFDKDTERRCITTWIAELGELDATFKLADINALKSFISKERDEYRLPYGRADIKFARRANLAATVNGSNFLVDTTGNRRFWTIPLEYIDLDKLSHINALQVWLQVWEQYAKHDLQGFRLTREEQNQLAIRNGQHEKVLKGEDEILDILDEAKDNDSYTMTYMTVSQFKMEHDILNRYDVKQLGKILDKIGIVAERKSIDGKQQRVRMLPKKIL